MVATVCRGGDGDRKRKKGIREEGDEEKEGESKTKGG